MKDPFKKILAAGSVLTVMAATTAMAQEGRWISGDFHQHSYVTDGSEAMFNVLQNGFNFGLDWQANSEHGGKSDEAGDDPRQTWDLRLAPRFSWQSQSISTAMALADTGRPGQGSSLHRPGPHRQS